MREFYVAMMLEIHNAFSEMNHKEGAQVDGTKRRRQEMLLGIRADLEEAEISWEGSMNRDISMDGLSTTVWASGQC